ncbi:MAG TPA: PLP-dependent aminotransferase family protein [Pseudosphingobacterium sp.]|nr:PLP-dependent aminotransferase family protein [Pseudosphingobacterium sp.]
MLPFVNLITINRTSAVPVYQQIANQLTGLIREGILTSKQKLPSSRELADLLQVHRKTVVAAYSEIQMQGWITTVPKRGVFVSSVLPELTPKKWEEDIRSESSSISLPFYKVNTHFIAEPTIALSNYDWVIDDGLPDARLAPLEALIREYKVRMRKSFLIKGSGGAFTAGSLSLREILISYLAETRGIRAMTQNLLITQGAQMGIYIAAQLLLRPGDNVIVGEPGYFMANSVFESLGANILRAPMDKDGIDVACVEELCLNYKLNMLYLIPHHHHPTTVTLSPGRRMQLIALAEKFNFVIVEDDYDYDFHYQSSPYLPLVSYNSNRVIYIGSLTKCLAPSIRIGFMVAPVELIVEAIKIRRSISLRGDFIMEEALSVLMASGDINRHIKKSTKIYLDRRDLLSKLMREHLNDFLDFDIPTGGMAIWVKFNKHYSLKKIALEVAKHRLLMSDGAKYNTHKENYNAIRFGFASLNNTELMEVIQLIKISLQKL